MSALIIFLVCVVLFISDRFLPSVVALMGCCALIFTGVCTPQSAFSGFCSDIVFIVLGTEIFGVACIESGLSTLIASLIRRSYVGENRKKITLSIIFVAGIIAAILSAFLNNQVVCAFMMMICITTAQDVKMINVKDITLPIIYMAVLGGQCTLIGAPATLVASSLAETETGKGLSMFELLPMGAILFAVGMIYIMLFSFGKGEKIWSKKEQETKYTAAELTCSSVNKRRCAVTITGAVVMIGLFITEYVSVGTASLICALICLFGGAVDHKTIFSKVDWNIIIWLGGSIGIANALNDSGMVDVWEDVIIQYLPDNAIPILLIAAFVVLTTLISNLIANTTTVIMILPIAIHLATELGFDPMPFIVAITMSAGLAILTPLSCGFIGMTMRLGYRFKDYVRYGFGLQMVLMVSVIILTGLMYKV